ncbi:WD40 repeat domain-containing protein [Geoalkalibacter subterraneus]|uniref:WD40 repeat domain-containing protein n=1 Tax=Geoalkalibacter subterraneus TaxID=483547 RepID=A0A0B5FG19_9BACT|nr:WD40 repeat domain-containing protein [Geoalkalibacter subterraneus]AJF07067.1 hypothetical protein GSUB_11530 [Geoalkalibacter subterraneus]
MKRFAALIAIFSLLLLAGCRSDGQATQAAPSILMVVSVSADGRYAVSSHQDNRLILWDIENRTKQVLADNSNIYSAYFVKGREIIVWQDLDDVVYVQNLDGKIVETFKHFPTYGHVLSADLGRYVASDATWNIFFGHGEDLQPIKQDGNSPSFLGTGKLINLTLSPDARYLLSAGSGLDTRDKKPIQETPPVNPEQIFSNYAGVVLWELPSEHPLFKFPGNSVKTTATLSPDGKFVVGGCENGLGFAWRTDTGAEVHRLASLFHGIWTKDTSDNPDKWYDKTGLIPTPPDLNSNEAILTIRFIDAEHYLCFLTNSPYAVLYHINSPLPLKYLYLGRDPLPAVRDYHRNAAMDTAPEAGILVMGQQYGGGIIVYKYDSETKELNKMWEADR